MDSSRAGRTSNAQDPALAAEAGAGSARAPRFQKLTAVLVVAGSVALALRLWFVDGRLAVSVPYWDQWDFLDGLFRGLGWRDLFLWQHGPHRQGLGGIAYAVLFPLTDWSAQAEALVAWSAIAAAAALCLRLKYRVERRLDLSDLFVALTFFSVSSWELFVGAQNLAHGPFPVALVSLAALLAVSIDGRGRVLALALVANLATFTGFGLVLGPPLALALGIDLARDWPSPRRRGTLAGALALLALGWIAFLHGYRWLPASECLDEGRSKLGDAALFVGAMVARAWGAFGIREKEWIGLRVGFGLVMFALLLSAAGRAAYGLARGPASERGRWRSIFLLTSFSLLFVLLTASGRSCLGFDSATSSRYVIYAAPGMVGVYLWAARRKSRLAAVVPWALALVLVAKEAQRDEDAKTAIGIHHTRVVWVDCYREFRDLDRCDRESGMEIFPASQRGQSRIEEKLRFLETHRLSLFSPAEDERARERQLQRAAGGGARRPSERTGKRHGGKNRRRGT